MVTDHDAPLWLISFGSVPGPKRVRSQTRNQDAFAVTALSESPRSPIAAAAADGHGASTYVRSGKGAEIAVQMATSELLSIAASEADGGLTLTDINRAVTERLPVLLHRSWVDQVTSHFKQNPLTEKEQEAISSSGKITLEDLENAPARIYGSTLLAVLLAERYAVFIQLGDGEIVVPDHGAGAQSVFPADPRALGDETASLASRKAWKDIQVSFHPYVDRPPAMVLLTTDGYGKAFKTQEAFLQVGADMMAIATSEGFDLIRNELTSWLAEAASVSGDDATAIVLGHAPSLASQLDGVDTSNALVALRDEREPADGLGIERIEEAAAGSEDRWSHESPSAHPTDNIPSIEEGEVEESVEMDSPGISDLSGSVEGLTSLETDADSCANSDEDGPLAEISLGLTSPGQNEEGHE